MKKKIFILLIALSFLVLLPGCNKKVDDKKTIYTSFYPIYDFTRKIVGDKFVVVNLTPAGMEPHGYEPTAADVKGLYNSSLVLLNGLGLESYEKGLPKKVSEKIVFVTEGIETIKYGSHTDPHVWNNPLNAIKMLENITKAVIKIDPNNTSYYQDNLNQYRFLFEALDKKIEQEISQLSKRTLITSHMAFSYFCQRYGMNYKAIAGITTSAEPSSADMNEIITFIKTNKIPTIFAEEFISGSKTQIIAETAGCKVGSINPLGGLVDTTDDYLTVMSQNVMNIVGGLNEDN